MNRDKLPIAWVAHANGQLLGTAALRLHDLEGREDLTPWLGGVFVGSHFRRQGIGAALCAAVEDEARSRAIHTLYLFTLDKQAWYSRLGWTILGPCVWQQRPGDIMYKPLQTIEPSVNGSAGTHSMHVYEIRPRKDKRGVDLISDALPFGRLWYGEPNAISNAVGYAKFYSRSHNAVIRVYDEAGSVIETHEQSGDFKEW